MIIHFMLTLTKIRSYLVSIATDGVLDSYYHWSVDTVQNTLGGTFGNEIAQLSADTNIGCLSNSLTLNCVLCNDLLNTSNNKYFRQ